MPQRLRQEIFERLLLNVPPHEALLEIERELYERSLHEFLQGAWDYVAPNSTFQDAWHIHAIADHLEAVNKGQIRRLLINCPPRSLKSAMVSVLWPMWTWAQSGKNLGPNSGPRCKFLCASYNQDLSWDLSTASRRLVTSPFYQKYWGKRFKLSSDQNTKSQFDNSLGGSRIATSVGGSLLGIGGNILILDDPHNTENVMSDAERLSAIEWYKEFSSTRFNDPSTGALVVIMQRLHQGDVSGYILENDELGEWTHLKLPMEFDPSFPQIPTPIGFLDPRGLDHLGNPLFGAALEERAGELLHPERFDEAAVERIKIGLGPYLSSGRLQQQPVPEGGAIIRSEMWQTWQSDGFPPMGTILVSLDGAFTEKEENDFSAVTVWGSFMGTDDKPKLMLMDAWQKRLSINDLVQAVADTCKKHRADTLLIEAKASGHSTAQEIQRLYGTREWRTLLINPKGDKVARVKSIEPLFASGLVYSPDRDYAQIVIDQFEVFPKGVHDDLCDSSSQALIYLRKNGVAVTRQEYDADLLERRRFRRPLAPIYDC